MSFFETSAKDSYNVEAAFRTLAARILESEHLIETIESRTKDVVRISDSRYNSPPLHVACSNSLKWMKNGFNDTVSGVKSGWKRMTSTESAP